MLDGSVPARWAVFSQSDNLFITQQRLHLRLGSGPRRNEPLPATVSPSASGSALALRPGSPQGSVAVLPGASVGKGGHRVCVPVCAVHSACLAL